MVIYIYSNRAGVSKILSVVLVTIAVPVIGHSLAVIYAIATTEEQHQTFVTKFVGFTFENCLSPTD